MNKNTIDLLNTLDNYKEGVELNNHKDPYIKNKYDSIYQLKGYNYCLLGVLGFFALMSINLILLAGKWDFLKVLIFTCEQLFFLMLFSLICVKAYENNQKKLLLQEARKSGNPYIEEIKEHYFYNDEIKDIVLQDIKKFSQIDNRILIAIDKKCLETVDLFKIQIDIEKKFKKTLFMKMLNIDSELEKIKRNRKKELWQQHQVEVGAKELRQHFLKNAR